MQHCKDCVAAKMRHSLRLFKPLRTSDGLGGHEVEWVYSHDVKCALNFSAIRERETGEVLVPAGTAKATMRYRAKVPAGWHAKMRDGSEYKVIDAEPVGRGELWKHIYLRRVEHEEIQE